MDIELLLTSTDRNPSGLASEANHKVPIGLTLSLLSLSTIGTLTGVVKIISYWGPAPGMHVYEMT